MCGDVEKNPGPFNIGGIVQASFSQGHEKFGVTQGIQCTCISLYSVFHVLSLFLSTLTLLSYVDLPRIVDIENVKFAVTFLENVFIFFTENCQLELFD